MPIAISQDKYKRNFDEIKTTYELEKKLAHKLKKASKYERQQLNLYTAVYDEFFQKVPNHPILQRKDNPQVTASIVAKWMPALENFLYPEATFLEVGPGDCSLSLEVTQRVKKVFAVDVSNEVTNRITMPSNFELVISDGCTIPVTENSIDIAYSHQLMEHLHPDDAFEQLQNIYTALAPGGIYICITPNRLSGPHDTSQFFDDLATGWHLKEYTVTELYNLFRAAGFSQVSYDKITTDIHLKLPLNLATVSGLRIFETIVENFPASLRRKLALMTKFRGITLVGKK